MQTPFCAKLRTFRIVMAETGDEQNFGKSAVCAYLDIENTSVTLDDRGSAIPPSAGSIPNLGQYGAMSEGSHGKYGNGGIVFSISYRF